jgi:hypothetical protein
MKILPLVFVDGMNMIYANGPTFIIVFEQNAVPKTGIFTEVATGSADVAVLVKSNVTIA